MELDWSEGRKKYKKTPISIITGYAANSDVHGVPFAAALKLMRPDTVVSYRQPDKSPDRLGLIDCDNCIADDGTISTRIQELLKYMDSYAEYSVSGTGIHVLCWLSETPEEGHKDRTWDIEFYWRHQTIPITGNKVELADWQSPEDLQQRTKRFMALHAARFPATVDPSSSTPTPTARCTLTPDEVLSLLFAEKNAEEWRQVYDGKWQRHYRSPSDADLALLMKLAFYTGKDVQVMDAIFSGSPLSQIMIRGTELNPRFVSKPKWTDRHYREKTIATAIHNTASIYTPRKQLRDDQELYKMRIQQIHERKRK